MGVFIQADLNPPHLWVEGVLLTDGDRECPHNTPVDHRAIRASQIYKFINLMGRCLFVT